jgi:hypothetical protein
VKLKRTFDPGAVLRAAKEGTLTGSELRKAMKTAEELGLGDTARELQLHVVQPSSFAGDAAPEEIRTRIAQGISALSAMGHSLSRTRQMLKRHGVIETINRIAKLPASTKNFEKLCAARLEHLTAEAIVLDFPQYFSSQAIEVAHKRLGR